MPNEMTTRPDLELFAPLWGFNRLWDEWTGRRSNSGQGQMIQPAIDIAESENAVTVTAELPGLRKEDVKLTIEDGVLTISGEKRFSSEKKEKNYHRVERTYGTFHRSFTLPNGVDADKADASFKDGVLTVEIPKTEAARPRTLTIK